MKLCQRAVLPKNSLPAKRISKKFRPQAQDFGGQRVITGEPHSIRRKCDENVMTSWNNPSTHHSLLVRLRNADDQLAWNEFSEIYQPLIFRLARSRGFQDADASEVAQEVLLLVSRSIDSYQPHHDGQSPHDRPSFRSWLARITRNHALNRLRKRIPQTIGGTSFHRRLDNLVAPTVDDEQDQREFEYEHRRQAFLWAAEQLKHRFSELNWQAFWLTCVEGKGVDEVARELGISPGKIYVARCRVIARLKETVQRLTEEV